MGLFVLAAKPGLENSASSTSSGKENQDDDNHSNVSADNLPELHGGARESIYNIVAGFALGGVAN